MQNLLKPALSRLNEFFDIQPHVDIISWAEKNIDFSGDVSAERLRLDLSLSPFLIEPLQAWEFSGRIREVAVMGIEQHGKTLLESIGVLYNFQDKPCSNICVYPSEEDAADINKTKYEPLIRKIPALASELERPFSTKKDRYIFGGATMFFQGAGKKIMSKSCKIVVLDEEDHYPVIGTLAAAEDARKRLRSYSESILYRVCTPSTEEGGIFKAFLAGSQGYWTLRCKNCGGLTMRSCDFSNFQFESYFDEERGVFLAVKGSERLICPKCHFEHIETDKREMNIQGAYVHRFPERLDLRPSFQFGAFCSQFPFMSWAHIAGKILECGKRADIKAHYELDNSYKGLPYTPRKIATEDAENLKIHFYHDPPKLEDVELCFLVSDTQDLFSPTGLFCVDRNDNIYLLKYDNIPYLWLSEAEKEDIERRNGATPVTVEDWLNTPFHFPGGPLLPVFQVVDYRGHRQREIADYAAGHRQVFMYAGAALKGEPWRPSAKNPRMLLVDARSFQRQVIWYLYKQHDKSSNFLFLPDTLEQKYQAEITCVQPDNTHRSGHLPENWKPAGEAVHDAFDVLKMAYFGFDFAVKTFKRTRFRIGKSPALLRRWRLLEKKKSDNEK